ncbi:hypothetical protein BH18ACI5_BH18ACI5_18810 [soil metagenome]
MFPIFPPPLRDQLEDIPLLAEHFVAVFAARLHTGRPRLRAAVLEKLASYGWPGNIRELQNVIERAVLLAAGGEIIAGMIPAPPRGTAVGAARFETDGGGRPGSGPKLESFHEAERRAILGALETTAWRISGQAGAATMLGLKPTTLHAKMKKLGRRRPGTATK